MVWVSTSKSFHVVFSCIHVTTLLLGSLLHHTFSGCLPSFCMRFSFCSHAPCIQPHSLLSAFTTHMRGHARTPIHIHLKRSLHIHENMVTCLSGLAYLINIMIYLHPFPWHCQHFIFMADYDSIMFTTFLYSFIFDRHLGSFHFLAVVE